MAEPAVFGRRLAIVTGLAQRLVIGRVPHESMVATMRRDVVDNGCGFDAPGITAPNAQRMRLQERDAVPLPARRVTPLGCRAALGILLALTLRSVSRAQPSALHQHTASRAW